LKININCDKIDEELLFKKMKITGLGDEISTPIKASFSGNPISKVNEIYKKFSLEKLKKCTEDETFERKANREIQYLKTDKADFVLVDYGDIELPKRKIIETLSDIQYPYSDVIITPICSKITRELKGDDLISSFMNITNDFIEVVETMNNKTIFFFFSSRMPRQFLEPIIKNYHDKNITSYVIDFDGRSIDTNLSWSRDLLKTFKKYDLIDKSILYSINANQGKFIKNATEIVAKDFVSSAFGIDIIGLNHVPPRMPTAAWAKIKKERRPSTFRLFDRNSYGYCKKTLDDLKSLGISKREQMNIYNINEQYNETITIKERLSEKNTIEPYIRTKSQITDDIIKKIKKVKSETI